MSIRFLLRLLTYCTILEGEPDARGVSTQIRVMDVRRQRARPAHHALVDRRRPRC